MCGFPCELGCWLRSVINGTKPVAVQKSVRGDKESTTKHDACVCVSHTLVGQ